MTRSLVPMRKMKARLKYGDELAAMTPSALRAEERRLERLIAARDHTIRLLQAQRRDLVDAHREAGRALKAKAP